jgi:hypothetical protein
MIAAYERLHRQEEGFARLLLRRHAGDTRASIEEARELREMGEYGRAFYAAIEAALWLRLALEREEWRN